MSVRQHYQYIFRVTTEYIFSGYKLRERIGKALKTRAQAIRRALNDYNTAAAQLNPPRESLTWAKLMDTSTLADFDLLRDCRQDIREQPWTQPARREAMNLYFGIKHAEEEILRLNVEIRRLITFMVDDHRDYHRTISAHIIVNPALASELSYQWQHREQIHSKIARRLHQTSWLKGFTGTLLPGTREGSEGTFDVTESLPRWIEDVFGLVVTYDEEDDDDEHAKEVVADSGLVVQLLENISMSDEVDINSSET